MWCPKNPTGSDGAASLKPYTTVRWQSAQLPDGHGKNGRQESAKSRPQESMMPDEQLGVLTRAWMVDRSGVMGGRGVEGLSGGR